MKNIRFLGPAHPYRGGIATFSEKLARTFQCEGATVKLMNFTVQYPSFLFPGKTQYTDSPTPEGLEIQRRLNSVNPLSWIRVGWQLRRERPDAVIVRYWTPYLAPSLGTVCRIARSNKHTRILALTDNVIPHERHFYDGMLTRYFIGSADGFICMSDEVIQDLRKYTRKKPALFSPHPLYDSYGDAVSREAACAYLNIAPACRYLLFFGFVRDYKGLDLLLDAFALLICGGNHPDLKLIVAGEYYNDKEKYTSQIDRLQIGNQVILLDRFIPDAEVKYLFSVADLVVQPYKSATQSGVTQIAYHFGVPMVVTNAGGLPEIVPDGKVGYVTSRQPEDIAQAIRRFYGENKNEEFRRNIQSEKKRFGWDRLTARFRELYKLLNTNDNKKGRS